MLWHEKINYKLFLGNRVLNKEKSKSLTKAIDKIPEL
jgi:hypothetical protein